jgi:hypothetical protein
MVTTRDDLAQVAALEQFQSDLETFIFQQCLAAKLTFVLTPIPTCDLTVDRTAAAGLIEAERCLVFLVGGVPLNTVTDATVATTSPFLSQHMVADCRTPDATVVSMWTTSAAERMAINFKAGFQD